NPLAISGKATLDGSLLLKAPASTYTVGATERVLTAGQVAGTFDEVSAANDFFYTASLSYAGSTVTANLTRASAASAATASVQLASVQDGARQADALVAALDDRVLSGRTEGLDRIIASTASLLAADNATVAAALPLLTGQIHGVERTIGVQTALNDAREAADRLPFLAETFAPTAWVAGNATNGSTSRTGYASADYDQDSVSVGVDLPVADTTVVGAALTKGRVRGSIGAEGARFDADSFGVTGYLFQPLSRDAYVSAVVGYGTSEVESDRIVAFGNGYEALASSRDDSAWTARVEAGARLGNGISPFVAVGMVSQKQDAFAEQAESGLGLS